MAHIPYGYKIENGMAAPDSVRASQVKNLFKEYLKGASLRSAAEASGINLPHPSIGRILDNPVYLGDGFYPVIVNEKMWNETAMERKRRAEALGRNKNYFSDDKSNISPFWDKVFCSECGCVYRRYWDDRRERWKCSNRMGKNRLCHHSPMVPECSLEDAFMRVIGQLNIPEINEKPITQKHTVQKKYDDPFRQAEYAYSQTQIDDFDYQTEKLLTELQDTPVEFHGKFMRKIIKRIEVTYNGTAVFVLINGKQFREELILDAKP